MSFGQDDKRFFLCSGTGEIEVRSWPEFKIIRSLPAHPGAVFCLAMNPKGTTPLLLPVLTVSRQQLRRGKCRLADLAVGYE